MSKHQKPRADDVLPIAALTPDPHNRRTHPERNVAMIADSLRAVGVGRSIVLDEANEVLAGNGVLQAAPRAGIDHVRVIDVDGDTLVALRRRGLTDEQKRALAIFDNRTAELAAWNVDQLAADLQHDPFALLSFFTDDELRALKVLPDVREGRTDPDAVPAPRATDIQVGDLFELGPHRLLCGDSTRAEDVARVMQDARADCVFTSPPYGVGIDYEIYQDTFDNLRALLPRLAARWFDVVAPGGFAVVNFADIVGGKSVVGTDEPCEYPMALEYWPAFRAVGWLLWSRRIWCKPGGSSNNCINSNRAAATWEHMWTWKRPGPPIIAQQLTGVYPSQLGWRDTSSEGRSDISADVHGATMSVAPARWLIATHARASGAVHEPFTGSGTTMMACEQLDRRAFGVELNPRYCQVAIDRWEAFTGGQARKVGDDVRARGEDGTQKRPARRRDGRGVMRARAAD